MNDTFRILAIIGAASLFAVPLSGCVEQTSVKPDLGPMTYEGSGAMPCAAGAPTFDQACGWRVLRQPGGEAEIRISNITVRDRPAYRVLTFSEGAFTTRDGAPLQVATEGERWTVTVAGNEHYRFADAVINGG